MYFTIYYLQANTGTHHLNSQIYHILNLFLHGLEQYLNWVGLEHCVTE